MNENRHIQKKKDYNLNVPKRKRVAPLTSNIDE